MGPIELLRSQKNSVLEAIKDRGLDPFNFEWTRSSSYQSPFPVPKILYKETDFFYVFDLKEGKHYAVYSPSHDGQFESKYPGSWDGQLSHFRNWLSYVHREIMEPDLWGELGKYQLQGSIYDESFNEPFTAYQVEKVTEGVNHIRAYIESYSWADNEQMVQVNQKLDYLINASKRQGRSDWIHTSVGVLISLSTSLALAPEQTRTLWEILKQSVSDLIKFLPS